jgi:hypothetical protein
MGAVEVTFKYRVWNSKCTRFSVSKIVDVIEWTPKDKPNNKYLFPKEVSIRPSIRETCDRFSNDFSKAVYIVNEGDLLTVDYSTGSWKNTHHSDYALLIARKDGKGVLDGIEVENAEVIYSKHNDQLTLIAHKALVDQGYLVSQNKPFSCSIAFYARQVLNKSINMPQMSDPELAEAEEKLREKLKSLMEMLLNQ